jgi:hypothetical protein
MLHPATSGRSGQPSGLRSSVSSNACSTRHQRIAHARLLRPPDARTDAPFPQTLTTATLDRSSSGRGLLVPCRATAKPGQASSSHLSRHPACREATCCGPVERDLAILPAGAHGGFCTHQRRPLGSSSYAQPARPCRAETVVGQVAHGSDCCRGSGGRIARPQSSGASDCGYSWWSFVFTLGEQGVPAPSLGRRRCVGLSGRARQTRPEAEHDGTCLEVSQSAKRDLSSGDGQCS